MATEPVTHPQTEPPDRGKPYVPVSEDGGPEQWVLLATDKGDGVTESDFDFPDTRK